ncbi:uncharacterized protein PSFLO_01952 [Pseudozyma flocculosa]|uniref:Secreted protein n=1 Tax=Pseudozyma flocculosa TaxID=84751 RepID=A0A5C3EZR5_9BASI|nr:uncharacterized protein PSFLO_01952 [Pseudozyma flocculosa]
MTAAMPWWLLASRTICSALRVRHAQAAHSQNSGDFPTTGIPRVPYGTEGDPTDACLGPGRVHRHFLSSETDAGPSRGFPRRKLEGIDTPLVDRGGKPSSALGMPDVRTPGNKGKQHPKGERGRVSHLPSLYGKRSPGHRALKEYRHAHPLAGRRQQPA